MNYGPAIEALLKLVIPLLIGVFLLSRVSRSGSNRLKVEILKQEQKDHDEFIASGEEWDDMGGVTGIVKRRLQRRSWKLFKN